ncbi:hypothetical protein K437DRAFT_292400 [Tilletiaria anomala UBC 951]|uniref:Uncharacterized protein n=1 Tax=Tilletiaria anomala (strain ATCC 24038 / CBS 436.72 / UBC 951) TaxID=1037660 RepID=A0A066WGR6_TILAU|nr:uncharacterized protein K437DRAFT_292400 [Tilletiaria anomala UBC 951]KDN53192.1 hypothetical protein K437DRAFT_292400 [Tilletiaria anomala UBC 951]
MLSSPAGRSRPGDEADDIRRSSTGDLRLGGLQQRPPALSLLKSRADVHQGLPTEQERTLHGVPAADRPSIPIYDGTSGPRGISHLATTSRQSVPRLHPGVGSDFDSFSASQPATYSWRRGHRSIVSTSASQPPLASSDARLPQDAAISHNSIPSGLLHRGSRYPCRMLPTLSREPCTSQTSAASESNRGPCTLLRMPSRYPYASSTGEIQGNRGDHSSRAAFDSGDSQADKSSNDTIVLHDDSSCLDLPVLKKVKLSPIKKSTQPAKHTLSKYKSLVPRSKQRPRKELEGTVSMGAAETGREVQISSDKNEIWNAWKADVRRRGKAGQTMESSSKQYQLTSSYHPTPKCLAPACSSSTLGKVDEQSHASPQNAGGGLSMQSIGDRSDRRPYQSLASSEAPGLKIPGSRTSDVSWETLVSHDISLKASSALRSTAWPLRRSGLLVRHVPLRAPSKSPTVSKSQLSSSLRRRVESNIAFLHSELSPDSGRQVTRATRHPNRAETNGETDEMADEKFVALTNGAAELKERAQKKGRSELGQEKSLSREAVSLSPDEDDEGGEELLAEKPLPFDGRLLDPELVAEPQAEKEASAKAEDVPAAEADVEAKTEAQLRAEADSTLKPEAGARGEEGAEAEAKSKTKTTTKTKTKAEPEPEGKAVAEADAEAEAEAIKVQITHPNAAKAGTQRSVGNSAGERAKGKEKLYTKTTESREQELLPAHPFFCEDAVWRDEPEAGLIIKRTRDSIARARSVGWVDPNLPPPRLSKGTIGRRDDKDSTGSSDEACLGRRPELDALKALLDDTESLSKRPRPFYNDAISIGSETEEDDEERPYDSEENERQNRQAEKLNKRKRQRNAAGKCKRSILSSRSKRKQTRSVSSARRLSIISNRNDEDASSRKKAQTRKSNGFGSTAPSISEAWLEAQNAATAQLGPHIPRSRSASPLAPPSLPDVDLHPPRNVKHIEARQSPLTGLLRHRIERERSTENVCDKITGYWGGDAWRWEPWVILDKEQRALVQWNLRSFHLGVALQVLELAKMTSADKGSGGSVPFAASLAISQAILRRDPEESHIQAITRRDLWRAAVSLVGMECTTWT